ncbi:Hypothetical protein, putative [Bodo saltans]|uniref:Uncharacterized protein n=1 Tax=Bodo saltans TaxID=75058 RepID=A0A0S4JLP6_BODSA|nr:Hypothetical protein, putative [Bodo saltans]|eukprot:CUG90030.1 Hypothetical protein, putative [Bodo saltans]
MMALATHEHDATHVVAASKVQSRAGMWRNCLRLLQYYHKNKSALTPPDRHSKKHVEHRVVGGSDDEDVKLPSSASSGSPAASSSSSSLLTLNLVAIRTLCQAATRGRGGGGGDTGNENMWELSVRLCADAIAAAQSTAASSLQQPPHHHQNSVRHRRHLEDRERLSSACSLVISIMPQEAHWQKKALSNHRWKLLNVPSGMPLTSPQEAPRITTTTPSSGGAPSPAQAAVANHDSRIHDPSNVQQPPQRERLFHAIDSRNSSNRAEHFHHDSSSSGNNDRRKVNNSTASQPEEVVNTPRDVHVIQGNMYLTHILRYGSLNASTLARRNRQAWIEAILCFQHLQPHPSIVSVNILAKILGNYRRTDELFKLACELPLTTFGIHSSRRRSDLSSDGSGSTAKAFAEAAFECHSWQCGLALLELDKQVATRDRDIHDSDDKGPPSSSSSHSLLSELISTPLTPSAAIPALIALRQNKQCWNVALDWWWRSGGGGGGKPTGGGGAAQLGSQMMMLSQNQKVSSYVAQHVAVATHAHLRGGGGGGAIITAKSSTHAIPHLSWHWRTALEIIGSTAHFHPARAIVFGMQALHLSSCWVKAIELYQEKSDFLFEHGPRELSSVQAIICDESARKWIPGDVVLAARRATWWQPPRHERKRGGNDNNQRRDGFD